MAHCVSVSDSKKDREGAMGEGWKQEFVQSVGSDGAEQVQMHHLRFQRSLGSVTLPTAESFPTVKCLICPVSLIYGRVTAPHKKKKLQSVSVGVNQSDNKIVQLV